MQHLFRTLRQYFHALKRRRLKSERIALRKRRVRAALLYLIAIPLFALSSARSQEPSQAPQIQTEHKPDGVLKSQQNPDTEAKPPPHMPAATSQIIAPTGDNVRQVDAHKSEEEGTEFWPPFLGYRIKVTDSLLSIFTLGLFIATWLLFYATKNLVVGAEQTAMRQLRAYITVEPGGIVAWEADGQPHGRITARNVGTTPLTKSR
jgi:hypothetical protein